jgi:hypothetical protein
VIVAVLFGFDVICSNFWLGINTLGRAARAEAMITKDWCTYSIRFLRQERILRDHGGTLGRPM